MTTRTLLLRAAFVAAPALLTTAVPDVSRAQLGAYNAAAGAAGHVRHPQRAHRPRRRRGDRERRHRHQRRQDPGGRRERERAGRRDGDRRDRPDRLPRHDRRRLVVGPQEIPQGATSTVDIVGDGERSTRTRRRTSASTRTARTAASRASSASPRRSRARPAASSPARRRCSTSPARRRRRWRSCRRRRSSSSCRARASAGGAAAAASRRSRARGNTADVNRTRQLQLDSLKGMLKDATAYGDVMDAYAKDKSIPRPKQDVVLASLVPYVRGQAPVIFVADRAHDIREAVAFAEENKLKPIILGGRDAWQIAPYLKQHDVPVLLTSVMDAADARGRPVRRELRRAVEARRGGRPLRASRRATRAPKCATCPTRRAWRRRSGSRRRTRSGR